MNHLFKALGVAGLATMMLTGAGFQDGGSTISGQNTGLVGTKTIALTFDDGPGDKTDDLLDMLKANNIHGTFFMVGEMIPGREHMLTRMRDEGHTLGNHTQTHDKLIAMSKGIPQGRNGEFKGMDGVYQEIKQADNRISPYLRRDAHHFFRSPGGSWRPNIAESMNQRPDIANYIGPVYWDIGGVLKFQDEAGRPIPVDNAGKPARKTNELYAAADWDCWAMKLSTKTCAEGYIREIERMKGGIVLLHDSHELTIEMVSIMIPELKKRGYRFVSMDEMPALQKFE